MWITWDKKLMPSLPDMLCVAYVWLGRDRNPAPRASSCCPKPSENLNPWAPGQSRLFPTWLSGSTSSRSAWSSEPPLLVDHTFLQGKAYSMLKCQVPTMHLFHLAHFWHTCRGAHACTYTHIHRDTLMDAAATPWPKEVKGKAGRAPLRVVHGAKLPGRLCFAEKVTWKSQGCGHYIHILSISGFATISLLVSMFKNLYDKNLKCSFMKWWVDVNESNLKSPT